MTLSDLLPGFQGHDIYKTNIKKKRRILKTKFVYHINRKLYLTYEMVLCFVTLTDLYTRRAGSSASAEILVILIMEDGHCLWPWPYQSRSETLN